MGQAQQLFDKATVAYNDAIEMLKTMDQTFQSVVFENRPDKRYDTRITLA